jgi:hypothetical protein
MFFSHRINQPKIYFAVTRTIKLALQKKLSEEQDMTYLYIRFFKVADLCDLYNPYWTFMCTEYSVHPLTPSSPLLPAPIG